MSPLLAHPPASAEPSDLLLSFMQCCEDLGIEPYPAQEEAFEAIFDQRSVVLATPTGSGKSLVALAAHYASYWRGCCRGRGDSGGLDPNLPEHLRRSVYTAPTKALVNEKFFQLCDAFGAANVGLLTGDASVNADAAIICCTAEILESMALRGGDRTPFGWVIMDEFHYFTDPQRGSAWLIPLLTMTGARFLLMSATLHDDEPEALCRDLERRTGGPATAVCSGVRPVPLEFRYEEDTLLLEALEKVRTEGLAPVYVVSFRRRDAADLAPKLKSRALTEKDRERRAVIERELEGVRLDTPFGKKLREILPHGLAVHHGGMLPKYRRLVERLSSGGLISVISGTDTLGVGVNMPIRAVIMTQLSKGGGEAGMVQLRPGEFRQIAGRAGRKGHDTMGTVIVLPPEHEVNSARKKRKAMMSGKKFHPENPPPGFKGWNHQTLERLRDGSVGRLVPRFAVTGPIVLQILRRHDDGRAALERLITSVGVREAEHRETAQRILEDFETSGLARRLDAPDASGSWYDLAGAEALLDSFDRPLVPFVRWAIERLESADPEFDLKALSIAESILDDPEPILRAQQRRARAARRAELWEPGMSMEQQSAMEDELEKITYPMPMAEELDGWIRAWESRHPHIADRQPAPKSVAREMLERARSFSDMVRDLDLLHHEQTLHYYLADAVKILGRAIPPESRSPALAALLDDLTALVESVDSSVAEEWERHGRTAPSSAAANAAADAARDRADSARERARLDHLIGRMARTRAFEWVKALARRDYAALANDRLPVEAVEAQFEPYWTRHDDLLIGPDARGPDLVEVDMTAGQVRQWLLDPDDERQWRINGVIDIDASREAGEPVMRVVNIIDQSVM